MPARLEGQQQGIGTVGSDAVGAEATASPAVGQAARPTLRKRQGALSPFPRRRPTHWTTRKDAAHLRSTAAIDCAPSSPIALLCRLRRAVAHVAHARAAEISRCGARALRVVLRGADALERFELGQPWEHRRKRVHALRADSVVGQAVSTNQAQGATRHVSPPDQRVRRRHCAPGGLLELLGALAAQQHRRKQADPVIPKAVAAQPVAGPPLPPFPVGSPALSMHALAHVRGPTSPRLRLRRAVQQRMCPWPPTVDAVDNLVRQELLPAQTVSFARFVQPRAGSRPPRGL